MMLWSTHSRCVRGTGTSVSGERGDDAIFALHLMRRLQQRAGRLLAHDVAIAARAQHEGGIRLAARELHDLERAAKARHLFGEIFLESRFIETMIGANFSDFLSYGHVALRWRLMIFTTSLK